jgi:hypothetical protein
VRSTGAEGHRFAAPQNKSSCSAPRAAGGEFATAMAGMLKLQIFMASAEISAAYPSHQRLSRVSLLAVEPMIPKDVATVKITQEAAINSCITPLAADTTFTSAIKFYH